MTTLMKASSQWMSRPDDERFTSLDAMLAASQAYRERAVARSVPNRSITARPVDGDNKALAIVVDDAPRVPTHWAFGQLASLVKAPAEYLRTLPSPMVADLLNFGLLKQRAVQEIGTLAVDQPFGPSELAAATGPNYGRIWNDTVIRALMDRFGDGVTGDFTVPGEFGKAVKVTKANTTLFRSDRDMFVFLADEKHRIEVPDRRNGQPGSLARGFFVWNSEVGAASLGISTFLFDYVCCNRIVWGARQVKEIRLRHTSGAPHRWIEEVAPALEAYALSSAEDIESTIAKAKRARIGSEEEDIDKFLRQRFTRGQTDAIKLTHIAEEGRPIETIMDAVNGTTAYARNIPHQDARVTVERAAGAILNLTA